MIWCHTSTFDVKTLSAPCPTCYRWISSSYCPSDFGFSCMFFVCMCVSSFPITMEATDMNFWDSNPMQPCNLTFNCRRRMHITLESLLQNHRNWQNGSDRGMKTTHVAYFHRLYHIYNAGDGGVGIETPPAVMLHFGSTNKLLAELDQSLMWWTIFLEMKCNEFKKTMRNYSNIIPHTHTQTIKTELIRRFQVFFEKRIFDFRKKIRV